MAAPPSASAEEKAQEEWQWDCNSNLYFHASTGFYYEPSAGWYYNTHDGLYYDNYDAASSFPHQSPTQSHQEQSDATSHYSPPSQWLDELLINQYLSGYRNAPPAHVSQEEANIDDQEQSEDQVLAPSTLDTQQNDTTLEYGSATHQPILSAEEENWMAQYGQVDRSHTDEHTIKAVDLWDWEFVKETTSHKGHNHKTARLTGQLMGQSTSMHPSLPSSGGSLKTTAIRQLHLDLVLVASGKVYRLRTPSKSYLATLSEYDSSNPTKDWGFPSLSLSLLSPPPTTAIDPSNNINLYTVTSQKKQGNESRYRDRAAERRRLYGANNIAPCQKEDGSRDTGWASDDDPAIAQEEARMLSFRSNSYGTKIMQSMGWKQGEALGSSMKGILEPVEARGNTGTAGLGWQFK